MPGHQMPTRTKRRLIAATMAAVALIGTAVGIGIYGSANAADRNRGGSSSLQCLPEEPPAASETAPPSSTAPTSESEPPAEEPPSEEPPAEEPPAEEPPAEEPPADEPPAEEGAEEGAPQVQGMKLNRPRQPQQPGQPEQPQEPAPGDQAGPPPPTQPEAPAESDTQRRFENDCVESEFGPFADDFISIYRVRPQRLEPRTSRNASRGTFTVRCGVGDPARRNSDNVIVAPGVQNGANHTHDYVGSIGVSGASTNESLAASRTTCSNGDQSTYYWPVIRVRDRNGGGDADAVNPHNSGRIILARSAQITFRGSPVGDVVAMPRFLRIITGDAKASVNGGANANARWSCTGFRNRITTKYPICPRGSDVQRISEFQSCWDGQNIDSANHRTHVVFPDRNGVCPAGTQAIPQLRIVLTYDVPDGRVFAVDGFAEVNHNPLTDHNDFINAMSEELMNRVVRCINSDRRC